MSAPVLPSQPKIPECVTPDGLRARADIMRGYMDESCARHLELAAARIEVMEIALQEIKDCAETGEWTLPSTFGNRARAALKQEPGDA